MGQPFRGLTTEALEALEGEKRYGGGERKAMGVRKGKEKAQFITWIILSAGLFLLKYYSTDHLSNDDPKAIPQQK